MGKGSSGSRKDSGNGPRDQEQYRNEQRNNQRGKYYYPKYIQEKLAITVLVITLALFALVMILYRIIKDNNEQYNKIVLSQRQQEYDSRVIPYRRGDIVDRNGTYLATSEKVYNLIIDPGQIMSDPENYLEPTIQALVTNFGFDAGELRTLIEERKESAYLRYNKGRQLTYDQRVAFEQMAKETNEAYRKSDNDAEAKKRVKGIWFEDEYKRIYPYNSLACNVIGFTSSDGSVGTGGIEQYYNSSLIGVNGREYGYLDQDSNLEGVVKPASNGNTVVSTIDVNIQNIVQKYIDEWQNNVGSKVTAAIVMNPNNGEILAMGTSNKFDLNNPRDVSGYTEQELFDLGKKEAAAVYRRENDGAVITEDQVPEHFSREDVISYGQQVAWNQIWRNFCVSDTYEPGSPSKIFTVATGLEEGVLKGNESFECTGYPLRRDGRAARHAHKQRIYALRRHVEAPGIRRADPRPLRHRPLFLLRRRHRTGRLAADEGRCDRSRAGREQHHRSRNRLNDRRPQIRHSRCKNRRHRLRRSSLRLRRPGGTGSGRSRLHPPRNSRPGRAAARINGRNTGKQRDCLTSPILTFSPPSE